MLSEWPGIVKSLLKQILHHDWINPYWPSLFGQNGGISASFFLCVFMVQVESDVHLFIYLFTSLAKRPGKLTEQAPLCGPEKKNE